MMIWDYIRDFFVQYIFGGTNSHGTYYVSLGQDYANDDYLQVGFVMDGVVNTDYIGENTPIMSLGDWLSTTATIICMCLIVFLLICLVRWVFRAVSSAMLLK